MISEYLMKGIDTLFSRGLNTLTQTQNKSFNKQIIKANIYTVVKQSSLKIQKSSSTSTQQNQSQVAGTGTGSMGGSGSLTKSRLRTILQKNKQAQIKSVIRKDNSRSISPYQRINVQKANSPNKCIDSGQIGQLGDKITYYRQQRKTIQKSRVIQKSRIGGSNSRIFRVGSQIKIGEKQRQRERERNQRSNNNRHGLSQTPQQSRSPIRY